MVAMGDDGGKQAGFSKEEAKPGGVDLAKVKIPEKQKSVDLCPVHLVPSDPSLPTWSYKGVTYRGEMADCQKAFEKDPAGYAEKARAQRWENNFIAAMSTIWCPLMSDRLNPGGHKRWVHDGITWESCCQFCDEEEPTKDDFDKALELLKKRARTSYKLTGGTYVEGAKSPLEGAMPWDAKPGAVQDAVEGGEFAPAGN